MRVDSHPPSFYPIFRSETMEKKRKFGTGHPIWIIIIATLCGWDIASGIRKGFDGWRIAGIVLGLLVLFCEFFLTIARQERD